MNIAAKISQTEDLLNLIVYTRKALLTRDKNKLAGWIWEN